MIKSFDNYAVKQRLSNNSTQWEKTYDDGDRARLVVDDVDVTRKMVRSAFEAQESGLNIACFQKTDMHGTVKKSAKTSTERSAARDKGQKALGRVGRKIWATPDEHEWLKELLIKLRNS